MARRSRKEAGWDDRDFVRACDVRIRIQSPPGRFFKEHKINPVRDDGVGAYGGKKYSKKQIDEAIKAEEGKAKLLSKMIGIKRQNNKKTNVENGMIYDFFK